MSPEIGALEYWENVQLEKGNLAGAEKARVLPEQYGDATQAQIAEAYNESSPNVSRTIKRSVRHLWQNSSQGLREQFILPGGAPAKIVFPSTQPKDQRSPETKHLGVKGTKLVHMFQEGVDLKQVIEELSLSSQRLSYYRRRLQERGITIPYSKPGIRGNIKSGPSSFKGEQLHLLLRDALLGVNPSKFVYAHPQTRQFIKQALQEGAHLKKPDSISEDAWIRQRNIVGIRFSSGARLGDIGAIYGLKRERIRQIIEKGINNYWLNCSEDTKQKFPLEQIPLNKAGVQPPLEYKLLIKNGMGNKVITFLEAGKTVEEIKSTLDLSLYQLSPILRLLKRLDVSTPNLTRTPEENRQLAEKLKDQSLDDQEIQKLLNQVNIRFLRKNATQEDPAVMTLVSLIRRFGYHPRFSELRLFTETIKDAGIPLSTVERGVKSGPQKGVQIYYLIASIHEDRVKLAFEQAQNLQRLKKHPVQQISGPPTDLPTTWQLAQKSQFSSPIYIFVEFGIKRDVYNSLRQNDFFNENCSVPVFKSGNSLHFPVDQEEALREYIRSRLEEQKSL